MTTKLKPIMFTKTIPITVKLLDDLKQGKVELVPGQWCYSKKEGQIAKYVGTFIRNYNGVVKPMVKFSYRKPGQSIIDWNKSFQMARQESLKEERIYRSQIRTKGQINERRDFTKPTKTAPVVELVEDIKPEESAFEKLKQKVTSFFK